MWQLTTNVYARQLQGAANKAVIYRVKDNFPFRSCSDTTVLEGDFQSNALSKRQNFMQYLIY